MCHSSSCSVINPIATPDTGALSGTQAAIRESVDQHVAPIEVDPPDARQSLTTLIVYQNSSLDGKTCSSAFSASFP